MPIETEYSRTYRPFMVSPQSPPPPIPAGMSSAGLGITQEPAVGMKKKPVHVESNVTLGDKDQQIPQEEIKSLKFKAGFRRPFSDESTEYKREFRWHELPSSAKSPILDNNQSTNNTNKQTTTVRGKPAPTTHGKQRRALPSNIREESSHRVCDTCQYKEQNGIQREKSSEDVTTALLSHQSSPDVHEHQKKKSSPKKPDISRVHGVKQKQFIQSLLSKQPEKDEKKSKRTHRMKIRQFVTEYQREFGKKRIQKAKKQELSKPPAIAGKPPVLDPSDPRLLKHSPLPLSTLMTSSPTEAWATNYRDNYTSPVQAECVFQTAAPLPLQTNRVSDVPAPKEDSEQPLPPASNSYSWYDQLVDIREKALRYKKRSEGVNIRHMLPLTRRDLNDVNPPSSTISECPDDLTSCTELTSCVTSSPTPSDSVSCAFSDCPHHGSPPPRVVARFPKSRPREDIQLLDIEDESSDIDRIPPQDKVTPVLTEPTLIEEPGRVATPDIQRSTSNYRRHHLDRTTPSAGGLITSPPKSPEPILHYTSTSPKFRRDMKSSALIIPAPKVTRNKSVQVRTEPIVHKTTKSNCLDRENTAPPVSSTLYKPSSTVYKPPQVVPASSSPHHVRCAPASSSKPSSMRKLDFKTSKTTSKTLPNRYSHRVEGFTCANSTDCNICGASLIPPSSAITQKTTALRSQSGLTSKSFSSGLSASSYRPPQMSVPSESLTTKPRPSAAIPSTNYMTRLPLQPNIYSRDADESSVVSLSLSSCSIASDVLRKAQERRDHFWTQH